MENKSKDSGFKLDIQADVNALGLSSTKEDVVASTIIHPHTNIPLPNSEFISDNMAATIEMAESILFEPSKSKIEPRATVHETKLGDISSKIKVVPEDALKKAEQVASNLELVRKDVQNISSQMRYPDNRTVGRDNYEERVTIPPQNLIFNNRTARMTQYPDWR